jgi:uncharacterized membrane protein YqiK
MIFKTLQTAGSRHRSCVWPHPPTLLVVVLVLVLVVLVVIVIVVVVVVLVRRARSLIVAGQSGSLGVHITRQDDTENPRFGRSLTLPSLTVLVIDL